MHENWLAKRGKDLCAGVRVGGWIPFQGQQERHRLASSKDATSVRGAFHIVKLAGDAPGEVRRRVQQDTTGHRGRKGDPSSRSVISCAPRVIGSRSVNKNASVQPSRQMRRTISVEVAYHCAQQVRDVFHQDTPTQGRRLAAHLIQRLPACPIPEIARLGRTLRKWKDAPDAYFDTGGASNAPHRSHQQHQPKPRTLTLTFRDGSSKTMLLHS